MSHKPIGIFDSGVGGLTVMAAVARLLPREDLVYFGDTAHVPYGSKSPGVVTAFSLNIARYLEKQDVKLIVVACNTASAFALGALRRACRVPVLGVIEPGARAAVRASRNKRIGVIGTEGTVNSAVYQRAIAALDPRAVVSARACPLFVPLVEEGWLNDPVTLAVAQRYLAPLVKRKVDTLVLGCTHYPLIARVIRAAAGPGVTLIDSAKATAQEVGTLLEEKSLAAAGARAGRQRFIVSDGPEKFAAVGGAFMGRKIAPVRRVVLD